MVSQTIGRDQFTGHDGKLYSDQDLRQFGTAECAIFRKRIISQFPPLSRAIKAQYQSTAKSSSHAEANRELRSIESRLKANELNLLCSTSELSGFSQKKADDCTAVCNKTKGQRAYEKCSEIALSYGIEPPELDLLGLNIEPCLERLCCKRWWKRRVSNRQKEAVEALARELRLVHFKSGMYCSGLSLSRHKLQKKQNREFLESQTAINELDKEYSLAELSDLCVSNPSIRRMELITRCKGFESVANEFGHEALFLTLTTPSRFHCINKAPRGKFSIPVKNENFDQLSPRDAQKYLVNLWAKIQAKFSREGIKPYGFRVAEPHHDGTPHWHFLLFIEPDKTEDVISIFRKWALKDSPNEKGAHKHRFKAERIKTGVNPETGREYSATGYLIKYICKNVDGFGIDNNEATAKNKDWDAKDPITLAERIEAWARTHRIRQFQQIGGPSVTVWRELRRLSEQEGVVEKVRQAADEGDWSAFVLAMGGPNIKRDSQLVRPAYANSKKLDRKTGEITEVTHTRYGDEAKERVVGVLVAGISILSRTHLWEIKESEKLTSARQKVMTGITEILEEIQSQNSSLKEFAPGQLMRQAQPVALDLCQ